MFVLFELQDKHGRRKKGWAVTGTLKGVRLDAEGGGAFLDDERITVTELTETPGAPKVTEDGRDANSLVAPINSKVSHDIKFPALFMMPIACVCWESTQLALCMSLRM